MNFFSLSFLQELFSLQMFGHRSKLNSADKYKIRNTSRFAAQMKNTTPAVNVISGEKLNKIKIITVSAKATLVLELNEYERDYYSMHF